MRYYLETKVNKKLMTILCFKLLDDSCNLQVNILHMSRSVTFHNFGMLRT